MLKCRIANARGARRTLAAWTAAISTSLLSGGCAVGPNFHRPHAPADAGYTVAPLTTATSTVDAPVGAAQHFSAELDVKFRWWESFGNPALDALVERALRANPSVPAAQAALRQAEEMVSAQRGFFFPTVGASYQFERQKLAGNMSGSSAPGVQGNGTVIAATQNPSPNPPPHNAPLFYNFHTAELTVGFVPDVFGGNRRQVESLAAQAELQRLELEATYVTLATNVVAAAIQEASVRGEIAATRDIIRFNERSLEIVREKAREGYAMQLDVATQETQLAQARQLLPPLEKELEQTRDLIRALAGNLPNHDVEETFELSSLRLPEDLPLSVPARLIEQRPDVLAAEQQLRAANAQVGVAIAAMIPQISITADAGGTATEFAQMFRSGGPFWDVIGGVSQPLFAGGTLLHRKRAASAALQEAAAEYREAVLAAYQNVADSLHAIVTDADALRAAVEAERAAKVSLDITRERMVDGFVDALAELAAEQAWQQAVLALEQAQAARFGDTAALYQALGGGWWNRDASGAADRGPPHSQDVARVP